MVDNDGSFIPARGVAYPAPSTVTLQHRFPQPAEVFLILALEGVAGHTKSLRENLLVPAPAM